MTQSPKHKIPRRRRRRAPARTAAALISGEQGFAQAAPTPSSWTSLVNRELFDLIVLDLMMPQAGRIVDLPPPARRGQQHAHRSSCSPPRVRRWTASSAWRWRRRLPGQALQSAQRTGGARIRAVLRRRADAGPPRRPAERRGAVRPTRAHLATRADDARRHPGAADFRRVLRAQGAGAASRQSRCRATS